MIFLQRKKILLVGFLAAGFALAPNPASAQRGRRQVQQDQGSSISMSVDRTEVRPGDTFLLEIRAEVEGSDGRLGLPGLDALEILSRNVTRPMSISINGAGQRYQRSSVIYSFVVRARREGVVRISPATMEVGSVTLRSLPVTISVRRSAPAGSASSGSSFGSFGLGGNLFGGPIDPNFAGPPDEPEASPPADEGGWVLPDDLRGASFDRDAFVQTVVEPQDVVVGQPVQTTVFLWVAGGLSRDPTVLQEPSADGFWVHSLLDPDHPPEALGRSLRGRNYRVYPLRRFVAYPLRAGDAVLRPLGIRVPVAHDPFDAFMGSGKPEEVRRDGEPITVHVHELPARPQSMVGLPTFVGPLVVEASLDRAETATGEAVVLSLKLSGAGNLEGIEPPSFALEGARILDPESRMEWTPAEAMRKPGVVQTPVEASEAKVDEDGAHGVRTFRWMVIPERPGVFSIPAFRWARFDRERGVYELAASSVLSLTASGAPIVEAVPTRSAEEPQEQETLVGDASLLPLRASLRVQNPSWRWAARLLREDWFLPAQLAGLAFALALLLAPKRKPSSSQKKKDGESLRTAMAALGKRDVDATQMSVLVRDALSEKLGVSMRGKSARGIESLLVERDVDAAKAKAWASFFESVEEMRFAGDAQDPSRINQQAHALLNDLRTWNFSEDA